jgi:hypothetical protein
VCVCCFYEHSGKVCGLRSGEKRAGHSGVCVCVCCFYEHSGKVCGLRSGEKRAGHSGVCVCVFVCVCVCVCVDFMNTQAKFVV